MLRQELRGDVRNPAQAQSGAETPQHGGAERMGRGLASRHLLEAGFF
jgi:hypothetical protein